MCNNFSEIDMDDLELLTPEHRKYCIENFKNLPPLRPPKKKSATGSDEVRREKDSAVLVPICRLSDDSVGLLYTKRSSLLRYINFNWV